MRILNMALVMVAASAASLAGQRATPSRRPAPQAKTEEQLRQQLEATKYQNMMWDLERQVELLKWRDTEQRSLEEWKLRAQQMEQEHEAMARAKLAEQYADMARSASESAHFFDAGHSATLESALERLAGNGPRESWAPQDPADSLWTAARNRFNRGQFQEAMRLFSRIRTESRFARSTYRPDAFYYEAFSLSRMGGEDNLRQAQDILGQLLRTYPANQRHADTQSLLTTIQARLAQSYGNVPAEVSVRALAEQVRYAEAVQPLVANAVSTANAAVEAVVNQWPTTVTQPRAFFGSVTRVPPQCANDAEIRLIALNALVRMDSSAALPVLREVMARRDECAPVLRERALMMVSRIQSPEAETMLFDAARNDPDRGIRQSALVWLSSRNADRAITIAEENLRSAQNSEEQEWALEALARMRNERAWRAIRDYAARPDLRVETRRRAIARLSQSNDSVNASFLRDLYGRVGNERELKEAILMSSAGRRGTLDADWLVGIAQNDAEDLRLREYALNLVSRSRSVPADRVVSLYDRLTEKRLRMVAVRALSERARNDAVATEKLIAIARTETDMDLRKSAVTALASVNDPRARELLMEILRR
jgi:hypothetical protein